MKVRSTPRVFDVINDLQYKNLVVGGCSFTYNISDTDSSSWPYYLRDKCGFDNVYDCSIEGASNYQIFTSVMYGLETHNLDPSDTLVIIMWSGYSRESSIVSTAAELGGTYSYNYNDKVKAILKRQSGKDKYAHALENFIYINSLYHYLQNQKYNQVFLNFIDPALPNRGNTFNILSFLPKKLQTKLSAMFLDLENFYTYCVKTNELQQDDFHPTMQGHLAWTHNVLAPALLPNPNSNQGRPPT